LASINFQGQRAPPVFTELAAVTGIDQSQISNLASGKRAFRAEHARRLGAFFSVPPGRFL